VSGERAARVFYLFGVLAGASVMAGAIVTHARNGDPVSDSFEAIHLLATLVAIVGIGVLGERARPAVIESRPTTRSAP
jgi:hypothetical protein